MTAKTSTALHVAKKIVNTVTNTDASLERERLTSLINSMADGVIAIDEASKIVVSNGAALNILDVNSSLSGKDITQILKLHDKVDRLVDIKKVIKSTKTQFTSRDWHLNYPDGSKINLYLSLAPVRLGYGELGMKGHVLLLRDITHEKSLEEERDEFISVISHELRTPVAIAEGNIGNIEFMLEKSNLKNMGIEDALKTAHEQINFLAGLINDLSTLSRAERGRLAIEPEQINAHELIDELGVTYKPQAEAKKLNLYLESDPHLELLNSSKLYVREILQNFITNAIKYTEEGSVTLGARPKEGGIEFYVSDTGIGISKADQEKVFSKFFRSEDYRTRANNGTGLGLYVTIKLSKLIKAEINMHSELNKGSTFTIFIPNLD